MRKIHFLDENTINKIAAGEVIERPASVVKELIENSIDAGASEIKINIEKGGKRLIKVTDNGCGMSREDAEISFLKHTTSKIQNISDLYSLSTMGFRGEALSTITAVSKVEIITKTKEEIEGTKIVVHGGKLINIKEVGASDGTSVIVKNLFYNIPARKRYLASDTTELAHIIDVVSKSALGYNNIFFSLTHNNKEIIHSPDTRDLLDTIAHIYGNDTAKSMLRIDAKTNKIKVTGYISKPSITRANMSDVSIFINNRIVSSRSISFALKKGYDTLLIKGRYPIAVIKIELDKRDVDINIHPAKSQVRLVNEKEVSDIVTYSVKKAISGKSLTPDIKSVPVNNNFVHEPISVFRVQSDNKQQKLIKTENKNIYNKIEEDEINILGRIDDLYIITKTEKGLTIIDQHAAHERVIYEQIFDSKEIESQELVVPINITLGSKERVLMKQCIPFIEEFGFKVSEFGPDTFSVTAVPVVLGKFEEPDFIHDILLNILKNGKTKENTRMFDRVIKTIACKTAVKAGDTMSYSQMRKLVSDLFKTKNPYTCPHGRPTMIDFSRKELDKLFKRR